MLSYQHAFHAGNHADILKHYVLCFVLDSLNKKDKPYTFYDTHSGSGLYDLYDNRSLKTEEAKNGIRVLFERNDYPTELLGYTDLIKKYLDKNIYPGSPEIEKSKLRTQDFLILSELHPQEIINLKNNIQKKDKESGPQIQIHNRNGWEMIKALTPPKTKRGGVLIDPSYEETEDYVNAADTIIAINKKWSNGIILLWYPLLAHREADINSMLDKITSGILKENQNTEILNLQFCVNDKTAHKEMSLEDNAMNKTPPRLYGSGMLVINAPWKLKEEAEIVLNYLKPIFYC